MWQAFRLLIIIAGGLVGAWAFSVSFVFVAELISPLEPNEAAGADFARFLLMFPFTLFGFGLGGEFTRHHLR